MEPPVCVERSAEAVASGVPASIRELLRIFSRLAAAFLTDHGALSDKFGGGNRKKGPEGPFRLSLR
jgi:hypothetical protein